MFHSRALKTKINFLYERCLHIVSDNISFENLLDKGRSVSVHAKNVQALALEMFTVPKGLSAPIVEHRPSEFVSV